MNRRRSFLAWAAASIVAMVVGSLGTWAESKPFGESVRGTEGDGWAVIGCAVIALVLILYHEGRRRGIGPLLVALLAALIASWAAIYDWTDLHRVASQFPGLIQSAWGIYVATIGSVSLAAACIALIVTTPAPPGRV
jgi:hypothetical protein